MRFRRFYMPRHPFRQLTPEKYPGQQSQGDTDDKTGAQRKIEMEAVPGNVDVAGEFSKGHAIAEHQYKAEKSRRKPRYHKNLAELLQAGHGYILQFYSLTRQKARLF